MEVRLLLNHWGYVALFLFVILGLSPAIAAMIPTARTAGTEKRSCQIKNPATF
jgi:uncharacterized membrane protein YesL